MIVTNSFINFIHLQLLKPYPMKPKIDLQKKKWDVVNIIIVLIFFIAIIQTLLVALMVSQMK